MPKFTYEKAFKIMEKGRNLAADHTLFNYMRHTIEATDRARSSYFHGASLDSRTIKQGEIFFPFKGSNIDAYKFTVQAVCSANSFAVVDRLVQNLSIDKQLIVRDTHKALQLMGAALRDDIQGKVIGVTGSAGKTTCKSMLAHIFETLKKKTYQSQRSFNTLLYGVPLSLINCPEDVFAGVFEAGMSQAGTLENISALMRPDIAIITSIQRAHIASFNNEEEIAYEKMQLINEAKEFVVLPLCKYIKKMHEYATERGLKVLVFGDKEEHDGIKADAVLESSKWNGKANVCVVNIMGELVEFKICHPASVAAMSAVANLLVCKQLELDVKTCANALASYKTVEGRGELKKINLMSKPMVVYDESYNANFDSMVAALEAFKNMEAKEKILVLGQMNELGDFSEEMHAKLYEHVKDYKRIFLIGKEMKNLESKLLEDEQERELYYVNNLLELFSLIHEKAAYYPSGTMFFVKGSRHTVNLDKFVEFLENYDVRKV